MKKDEYQGRKKEISRRQFTDNVWEITYQDGGIGYEGTPSKEPDPIEPKDIRAPGLSEIKYQEVQETPMAKLQEEQAPAPLYKQNKVTKVYNIGKDMSKKDAIDMIKMESFPEEIKTEMINDILSGKRTTMEMGDDE